MVDLPLQSINSIDRTLPSSCVQKYLKWFSIRLEGTISLNQFGLAVYSTKKYDSPRLRFHQINYKIYLNETETEEQQKLQ